MPLILNGTTGVSGIDGSAGTPSYVGGDSDTGLWYPAANTLALSTSGSERLRIDSSGNVGIGTSSPSYKLEVSGTLGVESTGNNVVAGLATLFEESANRTRRNRLEIGGDASGQFINATWSSGGTTAMRFQTDGTERMRITSAGNVGIGTSSPQATLDVSYDNASRADTLRLTNTNTTGYGPWLNFYGNYNGGYSFAKIGAENDGTGGSMRFHTADTSEVSQERMRIDSSGNLLVNSTSNLNNVRLFVGGELEVSGGGTSYIYGAYVVTTANAANVNVGTSGQLARSTSALKYKQDIRDLESIDINKFRPVRYKSKCEGDDQTLDHFGIIADEVSQAGITELVNYGKDGEPEGFQYERLTVVLVKAIQEQQAMIEELKAKVAALEK